MTSAESESAVTLERVRERIAAAPSLFDEAFYLAEHEEVARAGLDPARHFLAIGSTAGHRPNRLFDPVFYRAAHPEVGRAALDPFAHYALVGEALDWRPNPLFDTAWYRARHPELSDRTRSPLAHYLAHGLAEGHAPNPLFDPAWMRARHAIPDEVDPLAHFLVHGAALGLAPHPLFDTAFYLERHPEVAASGENPLAHYLERGSSAGYAPNPLFDPDYYRARHLAGERDIEPLAHFIEVGADEGLDPHPFFDAAWYRDRYPNVRRSGLNPLVHYLEVGIREDRQPNALFDPAWVRARHPELEATGDGPLSYYLEHASEPGFSPNPRFRDYARFFGEPRLDVDASARGADPLAPYRIHGFAPPATPLRALAFPEHDDPLVSVVIPVYGQVTHTMACLRSLRAARTLLAFEVLIVDDASPGVDYRALLADVPGVRVLRAEQNRGFIRGCNAGASAARGRYVVFLNNDTTVTDDWLDELVATFGRFPDVGVVGSKMVFPNGRVAEAGGILWRDGSAWNFGRHRPSHEPELDYAREADYVSGGALLVERALFEVVGAFDERYCPAYYEDTDLAFRVREAGRRVLHQPTSEVMHFEGTSQGTNVVDGVKSHQAKNQAIFLERWRETLARHAETGVAPVKEKDRYTPGEALVVDVCTPSSTRDARSQRLLGLMLILRDLGHRVTFLPENLDVPEPFGRQLRGHGIRVPMPPYVDSIDSFLDEHGSQFDVCLAARPATARRLLPRLRARCKRARILVDGTDLMDPSVVARLLQGEDPAQIVPQLGDADALLVSPDRPSDGTESPVSRVHVVPRIYPTIVDLPDPAARRDVFVVTGLQRPPLIDALLWLRESLLPALDDGLAELRFHVRESDLLPVIVGDEPRIVPIAERDLVDANALDRFRLAIAPTRFGASVLGPMQGALARGLPCVATRHASADAPRPLRTAIFAADDPAAFAAAIARLVGETDAWHAAACEARDGIEALYGVARATKRIRAALGQ